MGASSSMACIPCFSGVTQETETGLLVCSSPCVSGVVGVTETTETVRPSLLHVSVPRGGPAGISGLYQLVGDQSPNGCPVWKASHADLWMHSMRTGKWGIGGGVEFESAFRSGAAFVFCDVEHCDAMPCDFPGKWLHNRPAWTHEEKIRIERWPETVTVVLTKQSPEERYGLQTLVVEPGPGAAHGAQPVLRAHSVGEGSLLARWNAEAAAAGRLQDVVADDSDVLRVGQLTDVGDMLQALLSESSVEVELRRPVICSAGAQPQQWQQQQGTKGKLVEAESSAEGDSIASTETPWSL